MEVVIVLCLVAAGWWYLVKAENRKKREAAAPRRNVSAPVLTAQPLVTPRVTVHEAFDAPRISEPSVPIGRKVLLPDPLEPDDDYGDGPPVALPLSLWIEYRDAVGAVTARRISVRNLRYSKSRVAVNAFCHERGAPRCFISDRIVMAADLETGEILTNPAEWLLSAYRNHPDGSRFFSTREADVAGAELRRCAQDAVLVLVYVARADGRMTAVERRVILGAAAAITAADPALAGLPTLTDTQLQRMRCDHDEFLRAVRALKVSAPWLKSAVLSAAQSVMDADGKQDAGEAKALAWLRRSLA